MELFQYGQTEMAYLKTKDKKLGAVIDRLGFVEREVIPDLFAALINSVVGQQISAKAAATVWNRLNERFDTITPQTMDSASIEDIQQCGVSTRKAGYIKGIGEAVMHGRLDLSEFPALSDEDIIIRLSSLPGIGVWTAEMMLIFSMQRPDVVSFHDLAIRRGMMVVYGLKDLSKESFDRYRKRVSPYGSVALLYLWAASHER